MATLSSWVLQRGYENVISVERTRSSKLRLVLAFGAILDAHLGNSWCFERVQKHHCLDDSEPNVRPRIFVPRPSTLETQRAPGCYTFISGR